MKILIHFIILSLLTAGCSIYHVGSEEVSTNFYPSKESIDDVIYVENITNPYEVIGTVTVNTERNQSMEEVIARMRREAAILGADAITNITIDKSVFWKKIPPQKLIGNAYVRANFTATAVVFKKADAVSLPK